METTAFVYVVTHRDTGRHYVGKACDVKKRWGEHINSTSRTSSRFGRALRSYGPAAFSWTVIEEWPTEEQALEAESFWIEFLRSHTRDAGFNLRVVVNGGLRHAPETCRKIRAALAGRTLTPEQRAHLREVNLGKRPSEETRKRLSAARLGKPRGPMSEEQKKKLSDAAKQRCADGLLPMLGKKHSESAKAKQRGPRGPRGPITPEQSRARSEAWNDPAYRERMMALRRAAREAKTPT